MTGEIETNERPSQSGSGFDPRFLVGGVFLFAIVAIIFGGDRSGATEMGVFLVAGVMVYMLDRVLTGSVQPKADPPVPPPLLRPGLGEAFGTANEEGPLTEFAEAPVEPEALIEETDRTEETEDPDPVRGVPRRPLRALPRTDAPGEDFLSRRARQLLGEPAPARHSRDGGGSDSAGPGTT